MTPEERKQKLSDARELVEFLEQNPEVPVPACLAKDSVTFWSSDEDKNEFLTAARALGSFEKKIDGNDLVITKYFGSGKALIKLSIPRTTVCTKRTVRKEVDVEEWDCEPLLINGKPVEEAVEGNTEVATV